MKMESKTFLKDGKFNSGNWINADLFGNEWHRIGAVLYKEETTDLVFETMKIEYFSRRKSPFEGTYSKEIISFSKNTNLEDISKILLNYDILYKDKKNDSRKVSIFECSNTEKLILNLVINLGMREDNLKFIQIKDYGFLKKEEGK